MTEKRYKYVRDDECIYDNGEKFTHIDMCAYANAETIVNRLNEQHEENEQLKQFPVKLDNRITKLQEDLQKLSKMDTSDLNPKAVEDVATVIGMSLNALLEFKKELNGDVE